MYTIGIDMGGTWVKIGLISSGEIMDVTIMPAYSSEGLKAKLPDIQNAIDQLLLQNKVQQNQLTGITMAFPGIVDTNNSRALSTNGKYDDACEIDLKGWCMENWNLPFYMDNDARMATIGEWKYGAGRGLENMVMMTIGTGIGTGVVIDGRVLYGEHFQAGSLGGHFVIDYKGRKCSCGNVGCVEALSSSFFLKTIIKEHPALSDEFKSGNDRHTFKDIFTLASTGNKDALLLSRECMDIWSAAIVSYIHAYDPQIVVIGGGVMKSENIILPYIREKVGKLAWCPTEKVRIVASVLGDNAAVMAAEYSILNGRKNNEYASA